MKPNPPSFEGFQPAAVDFEAARTGLITPYQKIDIDVSVAPPAGGLILQILGDFIYQDLDPLLSNGNVTIEFNKQQDADNGPIYMVPGIGIVGVFKGIKLTWLVQAGKKVRLNYSTGSRVVPASPQTSILGSVTVQGPALTAAVAPVLVEEIGHVYGTAFSSVTVRAANSPENIIAAGSNVNGYVLWAVDYKANCAALWNSAVIAKAGVPATVIDGDVLGGTITPNGYSDLHLQRAVRVAAGKALDRLSSQLEVNVFYRSLHTLF